MQQWLTRKLRGREWNQADLARALGVPNGTVARWMKGVVPKPEMVERIADVFAVDPRDLMVIAGHIPADLAPEGSEEEREVMVIFRALPPNERQLVLEFARHRREQARRRGS